MMLRKTSPDIVRSGFTLLEILVVVAIIVVLAGVGGMIMLPQVDEAKKKTALSNVRGALTNAAQGYKLSNGNYPDSLAALTQPQPNGGPPLLEPDAVVDPWTKPYQYDPNGPRNGGNKPDIWTQSPKGEIIGNWPGGGGTK